MTSNTTTVVLESAAHEFAAATADPPYLFDLGPVEGRKTVDEVQSGEVEKPDVEIEDTTIPGGPSGASRGEDPDRRGVGAGGGAVRFTDKVAVVTGAGSGIGRAIAGQLHAEGAQVVAVDINGAGLAELAAELGSERIATVELDVSDGDAIDAFGDEVTRRFGRVDALFNNAGISDEFTPALETSDELWDRVVGINLVGPFRLSRRLLPALLENGGGAIVNTCSVASILGGAGGVAYSVSKHGLLGLTRSLAKDYGSQGVRVNAVLPGATLTGMTSSADAVIEGSDDALAATPAGRWAKPEEVAKVAVFLASDDASFVYGSPYLVDGGWSLS